MLQSSPFSVSTHCQAALPKFYHLASPPLVHLGCSLKHKQTVLSGPPGLFATFISDKVTGKRLDLTRCRTVQSLSYSTLAQKLCFFFKCTETSCEECYSWCSKNCLTRRPPQGLPYKYGRENQIYIFFFFLGEQTGTETFVSSLTSEQEGTGYQTKINKKHAILKKKRHSARTNMRQQNRLISLCRRLQIPSFT